MLSRVPGDPEKIRSDDRSEPTDPKGKQQVSQPKLSGRAD
jgi:hypothetical protein